MQHQQNRQSRYDDDRQDQNRYSARDNRNQYGGRNNDSRDNRNNGQNNYHHNNNNRNNDNRSGNNINRNNDRRDNRSTYNNDRDHNGMSRDVNRELQKVQNRQDSKITRDFRLSIETLRTMQNSVDIQKFIKKARKYTDLSGKKQRKFIERILTDECLHALCFAPYFGNNKDDATAVVEFIPLLAHPSILSGIKSGVESIKPGKDGFTKTSAALVEAVINSAIGVYNKSLATKSSDEMKEIQKLKKDSAKYMSILESLQEVNRSRFEGDIKRISNISNLPVDCIAAIYFTLPEYKFLQKDTDSIYDVTGALYEWIGNYGHNVKQSNINFKALFSALYNLDTVPKCAIHLLLEDNSSADNYKSYEYYSDVLDIWDALSAWSLKTVDGLDEEQRNHMIELYIKIMDKRVKEGHGNARVNLWEVTSGFTRLIHTIHRYEPQLKKYLNMAADFIQRGSNKLTEIRKKNDISNEQSFDIELDSVNSAAKAAGLSDDLEYAMTQSDEDDSLLEDYNVPVGGDDDED